MEERNRPVVGSGPDPCWLGSDFTAVITSMTRNQKFINQQREGSWQKVVTFGGRGELNNFLKCRVLFSGWSEIR